MATPFVSVLIDTYNHERFIEEALSSVLGQDYPAASREIVVVDDGSTDRTPEILRKFEAHARILLKTNGGQASAFNHGIAQCKGEIVAFLDGDDWWAPDKLTRVVQTLMANLSLGIVGNGLFIVNRDGSKQNEILREGFRFQANTIEGARLFRRRCSFLGTRRMTIPANILRQIGPLPEDIKIQADEYLYTLAAVIGGAQILPEQLTYYRLHDANLFQMTTHDLQKLRLKQESLQGVATHLEHRMKELGISSEVRRAVLAYTQACADQLRLVIHGGSSLETFRTEWKLYRVIHPEAPYSHRTFKLLTLFGALLLPPRVFYGVQRKVAHSEFYLRMRKRLLPIPKLEHIQGDKAPPP